MQILVTSINGPLVSGLVEAASLDALLRELNGSGVAAPPKYFSMRHPETGAVTLVPNGIGIIAEHG